MGPSESPGVWATQHRGRLCLLPPPAHLPARFAWHRQEWAQCCYRTCWGGNAGRTLTCLLNKRWSNPFLGCGEGCPFQSRSGGTVPSVLKTFSSLKHSVSIIWKKTKMAAATATQRLSPRPQKSAIAAGIARTLWDTACGHGGHKQEQKLVLQTYLILPRNGHASRSKFLVEVIICGLQLHPFHCGELLNVQNILAVDGLGLNSTKTALMPGSTKMPPSQATMAHGQVHSPRSPELA